MTRRWLTSSRHSGGPTRNQPAAPSVAAAAASGGVAENDGIYPRKSWRHSVLQPRVAPSAASTGKPRRGGEVGNLNKVAARQHRHPRGGRWPEVPPFLDARSGLRAGALLGPSPIATNQPAKYQHKGNRDVRPEIERVIRAGRVIRGKPSVQGSDHSHHERIRDSSDRIGIRIAGVEDSKQETAGRTCGNRAHRNMAPDSRCSHGIWPDGDEAARSPAEGGWLHLVSWTDGTVSRSRRPSSWQSVPQSPRKPPPRVG